MEKQQLSPLSQPACRVQGLHEPWVLPEQYVNQEIGTLE